MLFSSLVILGVSTATAQLMRNDVDTRYFITGFNLNEFPMSIDTCNPASVLGAPYQKAECISEDLVFLKYYSNSDCTTDYGIEYYFNATASQTGVGTYTDFNCDSDRLNSYTPVEFSVGTCDTDTKVTMNAAVGVCTFSTDLYKGDYADWQSFDVYCDDTNALLNYYSFDLVTTYGVCEESNWIENKTATAELECGYLLTTGDNQIYASMEACYIDVTIDTDTASTAEPESEDSAFGVRGFVALFAAVAAVFAM